MHPAYILAIAMRAEIQRLEANRKHQEEQRKAAMTSLHTQTIAMLHLSRQAAINRVLLSSIDPAAKSLFLQGVLIGMRGEGTISVPAYIQDAQKTLDDLLETARRDREGKL